MTSKFPSIITDKNSFKQMNLPTESAPKLKFSNAEIKKPTGENKKQEKEPVRNTLDIEVKHEDHVTAASINGVYNHEITNKSRISFSHSHQIDNTGKQIQQSKLKFTHDIGDYSSFDIALQHQIREGTRAIEIQTAFNHNIAYSHGGSGTMSANASIGSNGRIRSTSVRCGFNL